MSKSYQCVSFNYCFYVQSITVFTIIYFANSQSLRLDHRDHFQPYHNNYAEKCSGRLESALESMSRRNPIKFGTSRMRIDVTPYSRYHHLYSNLEDLQTDFKGKLADDDAKFSSEQRSYNEANSNDNGNDDVVRERIQVPVSKIEVAEMRVRLPSNANGKRWVLVDRCHFNARNHTLDTRLVFPDLSISGRVILHPSGGYCNMILRLRRAGIEFRTTPLVFGGPYNNNFGSYHHHHHQDGMHPGRSPIASVRTDSHFSEPGFLSVFAHGCEGPSGIKFRQNSKLNRFNRHDKQRRYDYDEHDYNKMRHHRYPFEKDATANMRRDHHHHRRNDDESSNDIDLLNFDSDVLDNDNESPGRTFDGLFSLDALPYNKQPQPIRKPATANQWHNAELVNSEEVGDALSNELEQLFSIGVRGLLTTYMQKALQPAIKETLIENMGYVLSYG